MPPEYQILSQIMGANANVFRGKMQLLPRRARDLAQA